MAESVVAPNEPPTPADARDPNWSGYNWSSYDAEVEAMAAQGLESLAVVLRAPPWAEGPGRPSGAVAGSWKPSESAFRDFAEAAARRYSGSIEPRVRYWQGWNEPNVNTQLGPQWTNVNGSWFPTGPYLYKGVLNAFYDGITAADGTNTVITAGTAPYGLAPGLPVMRPAYFWRVLCVNDSRPPRPLASCEGGRARLDVLAHHPYTDGPPSRSAANADDVAIANMWRLMLPLSVAVQAGYVYPQVAKPVWVTEVSYDSDPPDPTAPTMGQQGQWLEGSMYKLWKQGVTGFVWFGLRDRPQGSLGWYFSIQSGLYFRGATIDGDFPKPSLVAFRFPFTAYRTSPTTVDLWGIAPKANTPVVIQRLVKTGGPRSRSSTQTTRACSRRR